MPRVARFIQEDGYYHVISRSVNQTWIFREPADFRHFLALERTAKRKHPLRLFHYAIMHTHFHFVLQAMTKTNLSQHLAYVKWHYTQWMRKKYGWNGPLWRERYKSLPIEDDSYLLACGTYVEFNPVRAGICTDPAEYPFSSYRVYHQGAQDEILDRYPTAPRPHGITSFDYTVPLAKMLFSRSPAIGSASFIEQHRQRCYQR